MMNSATVFLRAVFFGVAVGLSAVPAVTSLASAPVQRTITGCVIDGAFISHDGYRIRVYWPDRTPVDLGPYEGKTIRYDGSLLPGDHYFVRSEPVVLGVCRNPPTPLY
ncbi:MAG: hypothetical protein C0606_09495 [Hyphomicrobiales bacterium]|nr:MAG: hypothetical protein C0606_09495 [Hyphomicrobiales bacterium]